jgi:hypothetical protein
VATLSRRSLEFTSTVSATEATTASIPRLLDMPEPKYDVASIALKVGKSIGHVYGRLRYVDLIEPAANAFLENRLTA